MPAAKTTSQAPWNGRFIWHDLMTKDAKKAADFYSALFGWQIQEMDMQGSTYRMILAGPGPIGGIVEEQNIPVAHWMPYIATPDVDKSAGQVQQLGGSVCVGPMDIPNTGRFAVVGDPQGAYFSLFKGLPSSQGFDPDQPVAGRVCWNELLTTDDAAAQEFYSAMFGWKAESKDMGPMGQYHCQLLGDKQASGIMKNPQNGAPSAWLVYFLAPNLAESTEKAKQLGARALMENMPIPEIGAFSMFVDPTGATFALFEMKMAAPMPQPAAKSVQPKKVVAKQTSTPAKTTASKPVASKPAPKVMAKAQPKVMAKAKAGAKTTTKAAAKTTKSSTLKARPKTKSPSKPMPSKAPAKKPLKKPLTKVKAGTKVTPAKKPTKSAKKPTAKVNAKSRR